MRSYNLFSKYLLRKDLLHSGHIIMSYGDFHAESGAHQVTDGAKLIAVKMDSHQE